MPFHFFSFAQGVRNVPVSFYFLCFVNVYVRRGRIGCIIVWLSNVCDMYSRSFEGPTTLDDHLLYINRGDRGSIVYE
jgi:hypothetical protein